jgi:glycosyltransferase involved in cell wall biosynthesis
MKKHSIDVISHSYLTYGSVNCKIVSWIPDFQHLHLPDFFSSKEIDVRNQLLNTMIQNSDAVILSSQDAYNDCLQFDKMSKEKLHVLQFVSQPDPTVFTLEAGFINNKHKVPEKYFYLPNQLWKHKNHLCVFKAIKNLKTKGIEINLLCSGSLSDYRNAEFINEIKSYVVDNQLEDNIKLLGLIDYIDVLYFMRYSIAVINPSLFEGWSSTVEECKSIGKNMILSDLDVHKEQNPAGSSFFELANTETLEALLESMWNEEAIQPNTMLEQAGAVFLTDRTCKFANKFESIVVEVVGL